MYIIHVFTWIYPWACAITPIRLSWNCGEKVVHVIKHMLPVYCAFFITIPTQKNKLMHVCPESVVVLRTMLMLLFVATVLAQSFDYLSESPVKLLTADLFGRLYPAAESEFRVSSNGFDQDVSLNDLEEANQMPHLELVLPPGGMFH